MIMEKIIEFASKNMFEIVGLLFAYFGIILPIVQYINRRKQEERDKRFTNFHKLVKKLVEPDPVTNNIMLDRQIAIVFELRNYPEYFELIERIIRGLRAQWQNINARLLIEFDLTLDFIKYKRTFILFRVFKKRP